MSRLSVLGLLVCLAGCGSSIGALDGLPSGSDVSDVPWPRLVDTPEPPEERLTAGNGTLAEARLSERRGESAVRLARAGSVDPVSDSLLARGVANRTRPIGAVSSVDEAALLARAERLQERSQIAPSDVDEADLLARAALIRQRASRLGSVDEASLAVGPASIEQGSYNSRAPLLSGGPAAPRAPVPLRPLDAPVVSSSFEERARLARERAAGL